MKEETIRERWAKLLDWYANQNERLAETNPRDRAMYRRAVLDARGMKVPQSFDELQQFSVRLVSLLSRVGEPTHQELLAESRAIYDPEHCI
jgi:hypothetical protein